MENQNQPIPVSNTFPAQADSGLAPIQSQGNYQSTQTPPTPPKKGKISKKAFVIIGIIILLLVVFLAVFSFVIPRFMGDNEVSITWWGLWEDESLIAPVILDYEAANPNIKITYVKQSKQDYRDRLVSAIAQRGGPDIFRFHNSWVPMLAGSLSPAPKDIVEPSVFAETFYPVMATDLLSSLGGALGMPLEYDAITLYINDDIFVNSGKQPPKTWDELRTLARELTVKDERGVITQSGAALGETSNIDHWQEILALMMIQNRASLSNPTGELAEAALQYYTLFSASDGVWDNTLPTSTIAFANGKVAMYFGPSWRAFEINQQNPDLNYRTLPVPQLPRENPTDPSISYASYWVEGVSSKSNEKIESWRFLRYLSQSATLEKLYAEASTVRGFGEPYPRVDMADLLTNHPVLGSIINLAPSAKSWYLHSRTYDGPTGINSQLSTYFEDAVNSVISSSGAFNVKSALETAALGVNQVLSQYTSGQQ